MAITTYAELKTALKNFANRGTEVDSFTDDIVTVAERRIYRELRVRPMETALSANIASGTLALPTGYVALKYAYVDGSPVQFLGRKSAEFIYENYSQRSSSGKPKFLAREAATFIFGPYPDSTYTIKGIYYKRLSALSSAVNDIFSDHPDLYLFAGLVELARFLGDKTLEDRFEPRYQDVKNQVLLEDYAEHASGGGLAMSAV